MQESEFLALCAGGGLTCAVEPSRAGGGQVLVLTVAATGEVIWRVPCPEGLDEGRARAARALHELGGPEALRGARESAEAYDEKQGLPLGQYRNF